MAAMVVDYESYLPPPIRSSYEKCSTFLYNSETGAVLGRTGISWVKISLFYIAFYAVLVSLFAFFSWVFFQTLDPRFPKWQLEESIIGTSPGLGFRPMPPDENVESVLIWYKSTDPNNYKYWTDSLETFLEGYQQPGNTSKNGPNSHICDYDHPPSEGQVCDVNVGAQNFGPCTAENQFGYDKASPCIFIKLNRIYNWIPEFYNNTYKLPEKMPSELKDYIVDQEKENPMSLNTVWVSCEGEDPADNEHIGPLAYYPRMGFPGYYYPYQNADGYLSPLVAVQFKRPKPGVLIHVECKAWAGNIIHDRPFNVGDLHVELMID